MSNCHIAGNHMPRLNTNERFSGNPCVEARSCHECITTHPACAWCEDEDYDETKDRCSLIGNLAWSCRKFAVPKNDLKILRVSVSLLAVTFGRLLVTFA